MLSTEGPRSVIEPGRRDRSGWREVGVCVCVCVVVVRRVWWRAVSGVGDAAETEVCTADAVSRMPSDALPLRRTREPDSCPKVSWSPTLFRSKPPLGKPYLPLIHLSNTAPSFLFFLLSFSYGFDFSLSPSRWVKNEKNRERDRILGHEFSTWQV